jgi:hypothetical protein
MFGWFRSRPPQPPLSPPEKLWVEQQMSWLTQTFGLDYLREVEVVLPTPEFFPEPFTGAEEEVRPLLELVCDYMDVDADRLDLDFFDKGGGRAECSSHQGVDLSSDALGYYVREERETILLERSLLGDFVALIATIAHEVAHVPLLGDGLLSEDDPNHEYLTDLLTVFLGLGVFSANSVIRETMTREGAYSSWWIGKHGYLSERLYGYALAVFAYARGEEAPDWAEHLRLNVRDVFTKGLDYLQKTSDTQFRALDDGAGELPPAERLARAVAALGSPSSGARLAALGDIKELKLEGAPALAALITTLGDADPFLQTEAAVVLGELGALAGPAVPALIDGCEQRRNEPLRLAAVRALGRGGAGHPRTVEVILETLASLPPKHQPIAVEALGSLGASAAPAIEALAELLGHRELEVACAAALSLGAIGKAAEGAIPALLEALKEGEGDLPAAAALTLGKIGVAREDVLAGLRRAMLRPNEDIVEEVTEALKALAPDAPLPAAPRSSRKTREG